MSVTAQLVGIANPGFLNTGGRLNVSSGGAVNSATASAKSGELHLYSADTATGGGAGSALSSGDTRHASGPVTNSG